MFKSLNRWYQDWRDEQMAVLLDPSVADGVQGYFRRCGAKHLATLSAIERAQLHAFALKYRGQAFWLAVLKLAALFCLCGFALYLWKPKGGVIVPIVLAQFFGWAVVLTLIGIWFNYRQFVRRPGWIGFVRVAGLCFGVLVGFALGSWLYGRDPMQEFFDKGVILSKAVAICGFIYVLMVGIVAGWRNKAYETITVQLALDAEKEKSARQESESQLRMLRAQIEPHFLFNTLGAVQTLAEQGGATKAAELTANLIVFLRACMHEIRSERISLGEEFAMVRAYLEVMKVRMGARLHFLLELPDTLKQISLPSMLILSLVENAIKHGLEPSLSGGEVRIVAWSEEGVIHIQVSDTGVGLSDQPGNGIGLQNVRDRLSLMYGVESGLTINEIDGGGVEASIHFPAKEM